MTPKMDSKKKKRHQKQAPEFELKAEPRMANWIREQKAKPKKGAC